LPPPTTKQLKTEHKKLDSNLEVSSIVILDFERNIFAQILKGNLNQKTLTHFRRYTNITISLHLINFPFLRNVRFQWISTTVCNLSELRSNYQNFWIRFRQHACNLKRHLAFFLTLTCSSLRRFKFATELCRCRLKLQGAPTKLFDRAHARLLDKRTDGQTEP
jgi:hypothetical protein